MPVHRRTSVLSPVYSIHHADFWTNFMAQHVRQNSNDTDMRWINAVEVNSDGKVTDDIRSQLVPFNTLS